MGSVAFSGIGHCDLECVPRGDLRVWGGAAGACGVSCDLSRRLLEARVDESGEKPLPGHAERLI